MQGDGKPFNRFVEKKSFNEHHISSQKNLFLKRLQALEIGKTYDLKFLQSYFNLRTIDGLDELLKEFTKWTKTEKGYELLAKAGLPVQESLPPYLEGFDEEYTELVGFFANHDQNRAWTIREINRDLNIDTTTGEGKTKEGRLVYFLKELSYRGIVKIKRPKKNDNDSYQWIGETLNNNGE